MDNILTKYRSFWICLALTLATTAVFYQVSTYDFSSLDDAKYVYKNPNIQTGITLKAVKWAFTTDYAGMWHPLTWLSHMLDWQLFGSKAGGHHLTNLIFHIANTMLLFVVLKQMTGAMWQSAFVAALFALHPLHVESVAWVAERKDVLGTFFWLLTMWAYARFVSHPKTTNYLLVVAFFALGLMSKPMLVTLPFVLLLLDYWPLERFNAVIGPKRKKVSKKYSLAYLFIEKIPLFAMVLALCIVTFIFQKRGGAVRSEGNYGLLIRLANASISYLQYIIKMIWPARLAVFYPHPGQNVSILYAVISAAVLLAITVLVLRFAKERRYLVIGWLWYLGTLVPVIGFVEVGEQALADRYSYITLTGLFIIIAWGLPELLEKWPHRKTALWASSLIALSVLAVLAHHQQRYWKDSMTLLQHALKVTNNNYKAHACIAQTFFEQGRIEEAIWHNNEALRIKPNYIEALNNLGGTLYRAGRIDEAIGYYKRALELNSSVAEARINLALALVTKGELADAVQHYRIALKTADTNDVALIHSNLGPILLKLGRFQEAVTEYREVLSAVPNDPDVLNKLGYALAQTGKLDEAVEEYRKCLRIKPDDPNTLNALGVTLGQQGKFDQAVKCFTEALRIKPDSAEAHTNLGFALTFQGSLDEAAEHLGEALRLDANSEKAHYHLGQILVQKGKLNEAVSHFEEAMRLKPDWVEPMNNLAQLLIASEKTTTYNPDRAIKLAQRACELTNYKKPKLLDTLAAAYAAAGKFSKAIETAEKALELCQSFEQETLKEDIKKRLALYKAGKPYIEK